jgi:outer membrane beta-barrel protein
MKKNQLLVVSMLLLTLNVQAQTKKAEPPPEEPKAEERGSDKVDLKKLEDKYWSAKDEDYGVIQNRTYAKAKKFYGSLVAGTLINDAFAEAKPIGGMIGYYFNEDYGLELSYLSHSAKRNENVETLANKSYAVAPNYNLVKNSITLSGSYMPFYAKMAFMNSSIMYFDMGFTAGIGTTTYDQVTKASSTAAEQFNSKSAPHFELGFTQQLFVGKNVAFRIDLKNTFYSQKIVPYQSNFNTTTSEETKSTNDTTVTLGLTVFSN